MSQILRAQCLLLLLAGCAEPIFTFRGEPVTGLATRLNDSAYSAGARAGERLGITPPADTPRAGKWRPQEP